MISRPGSVQVKLVRYTLFNEYSDQYKTGAQSALPLRLGPQIQTLLSREGRRTGGCRTGQSRNRSGCSIARGAHVDSRTSTKDPDAPALEGEHFSWLRPAHADATQGRWQLSEAIRPSADAVVGRPMLQADVVTEFQVIGSLISCGQ
jgi:hypothetical protein